MATGDLETVRGHEDVHFVDVGMYETAGYGSVYIIDAAEPTIVDTGTGANRDLVFDALEDLGIGREDLSWIVPTHVHLDHAGGTGYLADRFPRAQVRTPEQGVRHLVSPDRLVEGTKAAVGDQWRHYADPIPVPEHRIRGLTDGDRLDLGDRTLEFHYAPGHAPHHGFYHLQPDGVVFTADAAGIYVPEADAIMPTSPPPQFDLDQCLADMSAIADLDPETLCFSHFGPRPYDDAVIEEAKRTYVEWVETIRQKRGEFPDDEAIIQDLQDATADETYWTEERRRANADLNARGVLRWLDYQDDGDE